MRKRSKNIILKFPKISEIALKISEITLKSDGGGVDNQILVSIYSAKDLNNVYARRKSYPILMIGSGGLWLQYISYWCSEHLGIDNIDEHPRKLIMDRIDML